MMATMRRELVLAAALALVLAIAPRAASARSERTVGHAFKRVWPTAVRFLRIDEHLELVDKDADAGYVVFELRDKGKVFRGSLELIALSEDDRPAGVRLVVTIDGRPEYTESGLLDRLLDKLHRELGEDDAPSPPRRKPPAKDDGDGDAPPPPPPKPKK
jgi:hypothetical protein